MRTEIQPAHASRPVDRVSRHSHQVHRHPGSRPGAPCRNVWVASVWNRTPFAWQIVAMLSMSCTVPISWLACWTRDQDRLGRDGLLDCGRVDATRRRPLSKVVTLKPCRSSAARGIEHGEVLDARRDEMPALLLAQGQRHALESHIARLGAPRSEDELLGGAAQSAGERCRARRSSASRASMPMRVAELRRGHRVGVEQDRASSPPAHARPAAWPRRCRDTRSPRTCRPPR